MGERRDPHRLFIGTYTRRASLGIYAVELDRATGVLGRPELAAEAPNPTFLALSPDHHFLYAVCAGDAWASSFRVDRASPRLVPVQQAPAGPGPTPCHIAVDAGGRIAIAANYHLGQAAAIPLGTDGTLGPPRVISHSGRGPHPTRQAAAHVHSANFSPDGRFAIVCDLGLDRIFTYTVDRGAVALGPASPPSVDAAPGAGPRHFAFGPDGRRGYAINELDSTITAYDYAPQSGGLVPRRSVSLLPQGYHGDATAAEIRFHPNGNFLYGSVRGPDILAVLAVDRASGDLTPVERVPCGGRGPRSFSISPNGAWLVCAHQDSDTLCAFRVDAATGRLERIPGTVPVSTPVCALFLE
jgi:6-phosphogluconolactonase